MAGLGGSKAPESRTLEYFVSADEKPCSFTLVKAAVTGVTKWACAFWL